jgi:DeoR/GlpR family transcriptional regulator of sugar metabolism
MLAGERHDQIVEQVNERGSVLVKDLSEQFGVTEDSIRKDLTMLERKGLLKKAYGGAVKIRENPHERYASQRRGKNLAQKTAIAKKAVGLIKDGDVIFLDISTVNLELARLIASADLDITVVTNMIDIMLLFTGESRVKLIFVGGSLNAEKDGFVGTLANQELSRYRFDKAFLGAVGADLERDAVLTYSPEDASTKRTALEASARSYMMLEHGKLSADGNYIYAPVSAFTGAVLDEKPDGIEREQMDRYDIEWI